MATRAVKNPTFDRLQNKTLDARFVHEITDRLQCTATEANAVLRLVKEVYLPFFDPTAMTPPPGKMTIVAVSADEPAGRPIARCKKVLVCLTVSRGPEDDALLQHGAAEFRKGRIPDLCHEALSQGALLTCDDLAHRIFFVSTRTISRDLRAIREENPESWIPIRSTVHSIGPLVSSRVRVARLALEGRTTPEICQIMGFPSEAVAGNLAAFIRCAQLSRRGVRPAQIAFQIGRGESLVRSFLELVESCRTDPEMTGRLDGLLSLRAATP
jgi:hypothetical protein